VGAFLGELNLDNVHEPQLAVKASYAGLRLGVHSRVTAASTVALPANVMERAPQLHISI
jgi:hypothetical protein